MNATSVTGGQGEASQGTALPQGFSPAVLADPYPLYDMLRESGPFFWGGSERERGWVLLAHDAVGAVLKDERFSREFSLAEAYRGVSSDRPDLVEMLESMSTVMLFTDPPRHTRLRRGLAGLFSRGRLDLLRPIISNTVNEALDAICDKTEFDVMADLADVVPLRVIAELLGVPKEDVTTLRSWSSAISATSDSLSRRDTVHLARTAMREFAEYMRDVLDTRSARSAPFLAAMLQLTEGAALSSDEVVGSAVLLLIAGYETTRGLIGNGALALLQNPIQFAAWRDGLVSDEDAVDELARYDSPVHLTGRIVREDVEFEGRTLAAGEQVFAVIGAATEIRGDIRTQRSWTLGVGLEITWRLALVYTSALAQTSPGWRQASL